MKTLLRIDCSSRIQGSHSRAMTDYFVESWRRNNPLGNVLYRDLAQDGPPHIHNTTIEGFYIPPEEASEEHKKALAISDELISELKRADEVVVSSPLYNLNLPSNLKAYLDQVVRVGHTFGKNEEGYYGLLTAKTVYMITTKGEVYKGTSMEPFDFQGPYLEAIFGFLGLAIGGTFPLEGTSHSDILEKNRKEIQEQIDSTLKKVENGQYS